MIEYYLVFLLPIIFLYEVYHELRKWRWTSTIFVSQKKLYQTTNSVRVTLTKAGDTYHIVKGLITQVLAFLFLFPYYTICWYWLPAIWMKVAWVLIVQGIVWFIWYPILFNINFHWLWIKPEYRDLWRAWPWRHWLKKT